MSEGLKHVAGPGEAHLSLSVKGRREGLGLFSVPGSFCRNGLEKILRYRAGFGCFRHIVEALFGKQEGSAVL